MDIFAFDEAGFDVFPSDHSYGPTPDLSGSVLVGSAWDLGGSALIFIEDLSGSVVVVAEDQTMDLGGSVVTPGHDFGGSVVVVGQFDLSGSTIGVY